MRSLPFALASILFPLILQAAPAAKSTKPLNFAIVDSQTKKPVADVGLHIRAGRAQLRQTTDDAGKSLVNYPGDSTYLAITAKKDGYVTANVYWNSNNDQPIEIPAEFTLEMPAGKTIGGTVDDEDGAIVAGAKVYL